MAIIVCSQVLLLSCFVDLGQGRRTHANKLEAEHALLPGAIPAGRQLSINAQPLGSLSGPSPGKLRSNSLALRALARESKGGQGKALGAPRQPALTALTLLAFQRGLSKRNMPNRRHPPEVVRRRHDRISMQATAAENVKGKPERAYASPETVGDSYDSWTSDGILEYYWGDHIHLGYYPEGRVRGENFIEAKSDLTRRLFEWGVPNFAKKDAKLLDAGCGIGGSTRQLFQDYGFAEATGISLSTQQVNRATQLTTSDHVEFRQMDALDMRFANESFDIVWSLEMEPHIPDKRKMVDELLRVLKPGGTLVLGGWNVRDNSTIPLSPNEHRQMTHLLEEWSHPNFWSIEQYVKVFKSIPGVTVRHDDWSLYVHPSWMESITTMFKRPKGLFMALRNPRRLNERLRDLYTLWDWHKAMGNGLMHFGVFSVTKE